MYRACPVKFPFRNHHIFLGLENLYAIVSQGDYALRVELEDFEGNTAYAEYSSFTIAGEPDKYRLSVSGYQSSSTAGNWIDGMSLRKHVHEKYTP